jgi:transcriptional regulator with XRE-family HTH domain
MTSKIGRLIKEARQKKFMTLRELARRIGKSPTYIVLLERSSNSPGIAEDTLQSIAQELELDPDILHAAVQRTPENSAPRSSTQVALYRLIGELPEGRQVELKAELEAEMKKRKPVRRSQV